MISLSQKVSFLSVKLVAISSCVGTQLAGLCTTSASAAASVVIKSTWLSRAQGLTVILNIVAF